MSSWTFVLPLLVAIFLAGCGEGSQAKAKKVIPPPEEGGAVFYFLNKSPFDLEIQVPRYQNGKPAGHIQRKITAGRSEQIGELAGSKYTYCANGGTLYIGSAGKKDFSDVFQLQFKDRTRHIKAKSLMDTGSIRFEVESYPGMPMKAGAQEYWYRVIRIHQVNQS